MKLTLNISAMLGLALASQSASAIFVSQNLFDPKAPRPLNERIYDAGGLVLRDSVGYLSANVTLEGGGYGTSHCSSSAIGKRMVLAAAHCFDGKGDGDGAVDQARGSTVSFYRNGTSITYTGTVIGHPGYNDWRTQAHDNDIAVMLLDQDLPADMPLFSLFSGTNIRNVPTWITGYGRYGFNGNLLEPAGDYHRYSAIAFFDGENGRYHTAEGVYYPPRSTQPGIPFSEYYYLAGSSAAGDSGGPAYSYFSGTQVGIASYGYPTVRDNDLPDYGEGFGYTLVGYYRDWLHGFESDVTGYINWSNDLLPSKAYCPKGVYCKGTGAGEAGDPLVLGEFAPPEYIGAPEMPIAPPPGSDVPEPSALALLGLGLLGIAVRNR